MGPSKALIAAMRSSERIASQISESVSKMGVEGVLL
jgi:hypothetical protein